MITVALLKPRDAQGCANAAGAGCAGAADEVEFQFELEDDVVAMVDRLIGSGFGADRGEVIKTVIEHALRRNETIGRCDLCGLVDHHLFEGACERCRINYQLPGPANHEANHP